MSYVKNSLLPQQIDFRDFSTVGCEEAGASSGIKSQTNLTQEIIHGVTEVDPNDLPLFWPSISSILVNCNAELDLHGWLKAKLAPDPVRRAK